MKAIMPALSLGSACALLLVIASGCGRGSRHLTTPQPSAIEQSSAETGQPTLMAGEVAWPTALPVDTLQPWEEVDADGFVIPPDAGGHSASAINEDSDFTPGRERFDEAGDVTNLDEASRFASGASGAEEVSYAIYEVALASAQPGAVSADVNVRLNGDSPSAYWLGLSDYGNNTWKWRGPFSDSHIRITVPAGDYTSGLGSFFVCVVAYDGASFDLVGLGVNPRDDGDTEAPPAPAAPTLTPQNGGILVEWIPVIADDLAGYRLYYADYEFAVWDDFGVETVNYLEGGSRYLIAPASGTVYVGLSSVDISGNESALSALSSADAGAGNAPTIQLVTDVVSGTRGISAQLTATGAELYDFDLDGDGAFDDLTGDPTGTANVNTDAPGIIRPAVRGMDGGGGIAFAAVSLIIQVNSRPVAVAHADPASGVVPLDVTFTGEGFDDDGTIDAYAWDFEGDGTYDSMVQNPPPHTYTIAGMYNAKFRVTDNDGSFDVDTLGIQALPASPPDNVPPTASLTVGVGEESGDIPHTVHLDAGGSSDSDGSIIRYWWDFDGDGVYDRITVGTICSHTYMEPGLFDATVMVEDDAGATATDSVSVSVNAPPRADIEAMPPEGERGLTVLFDAASSSDPDGSVEDYEWDLDYDGAFSETGEEADAQGESTVLKVYPDPGNYTVVVRVTDDDGAQDTESALVAVHGWVSNVPDSAPGYSVYCTSLAVVNGKPAISYNNYVDGRLMYVRATSADGSTWGNPILVDGFGPDQVGLWSSLTVVNGYPAISYDDYSDYDLKYIRATNEDGSEWGTSPVTVDSTGSVGGYTSMVAVNGFPAISYHDTTNAQLKYVRAMDADGSSWGTPLVVDSGADALYTSMELVNGYPAISYYDDTNDDLKYVRATDADGSTWGTPVNIDSSGQVGASCSLAVVNGYPAISYHHGTNMQLRYVRAEDASGNAWGTPVLVDTPGEQTSPTCLAVIAGCPAISYWDYNDHDLKYVQAYDADGSVWGPPITVDSVGDVGTYTFMLSLNGYPAISYRDDTNYNLKFARLY